MGLQAPACDCSQLLLLTQLLYLLLSLNSTFHCLSLLWPLIFVGVNFLILQVVRMFASQSIRMAVATPCVFLHDSLSNLMCLLGCLVSLSSTMSGAPAWNT